MYLLKRLLNVPFSVPGMSSASVTIERLNSQELEKLDAWLSSRKAHEGHVADVHALDGYITCVAVSPRPMTLGDWLGLMFHSRPLAQDEWPFVDLMVRRLAQLVQQLEESPGAYAPWLERHHDWRGARGALCTWSRGFVRATILQGAMWEERLNDPEVARWMRLIWGASEPHEPVCEFGLPTVKRAILTFNECRHAPEFSHQRHAA